MIGLSVIPIEVRLLIWELCLPRRELTLSIMRKCESECDGVLYLELSHQRQVFHLQQQDVELVSGICAESRSVALSHLVDQMELYDEKQPAGLRNRSKMIRCSLRNDEFTVGQLSNMLHPYLQHQARSRTWLGTMTADNSCLLSQQLQSITTLVINENQHEKDMIGMARADGKSLGSLAPELTDCLSAMKNLRVLVVAAAWINMLRPPTNAMATDVTTRQGIMTEKLKQCLGLEHNENLRVSCLDT